MRDKGKKAVQSKASQLSRLIVEYVPTDTVKPNAYNPNRQSEHDFDLLMRSMTEDGFTQPIVCIVVTDEHLSDPKFSQYTLGDVVIVDGEHRWRAARTLGLSEVPVVKTTMTVEQMRIATLRHNRARGSEDVALTAEVLKDLQSLGAIEWAQNSLQLDDVELQRLLEDVPAPEALAADHHSEAWVPDRNAGHGSIESQQTSLTPEASDALRIAEKKASEARTEHERVAAVRDADVYRIQLVFTGEQAKLVRKVLDPKPAIKVLELCQREG